MANVKYHGRVPMISTVVVRDGKRVYPTLGKSFPFTADEINTIKALHPTALRKPVNETPAVVSSEDEDTAPAKTKKASAAKTPAPKAGTETDQADADADDGDVAGSGAGADSAGGGAEDDDI